MRESRAEEALHSIFIYLIIHAVLVGLGFQGVGGSQSENRRKGGWMVKRDGDQEEIDIPLI